MVYRLLASSVLVTGVGLSASSCSLLYDLGADQCKSDADCTALGFIDYVCNGGVCGENPAACDTNAECMDAPGNFGEPAICRERRCISLKTPECPLVLPVTNDLWDDNLRAPAEPIILGAFAEIPAELIGAQTRIYDLALTEFTQEVGGLAGEGGSRRPLVMVVCNGNTDDRAVIDAGMSHLADTVKVPGLIAGMLSDNLQYAFESKGRDAGVFFMNPFDADEGLVSSGNSLMWHLLPNGNAIGRAYAPLLTRTLEHLNVSGDVRVATVAATDLRLLADINDVLTNAPDNGGLSFNGQPVAANATAGNYLSIGVQSVYTNPEVQLSQASQQLLDFLPHVVIGIAADEFLAQIVPALESGWPAGGQPRPFYLLSPYHVNNRELPGLLEQFPAVRSRILGVNAASAEDLTNYGKYVTAFDTAYPEVKGLGNGRENHYDAAYYLIYSAAAAGARLQTGADLSSGMRALLDGPVAFNVGRGDIPGALARLVPPGTITLNGTMGPPDFDTRTGARVSVGSAWCIVSDEELAFDVLRYDEATGTMEGSVPCFAGF